jgi:phosphate transport system substrate-binding protein
VSALERPEVAEFFRFFTEKSADRSIVADKIGYVPKTEEAMQAELDELNSAIESVQ